MRCAEVTFEMRDDSYGRPVYEGDVGDLLWDPKGGEGHILVAKAACGSENRHNGRRVNCGCGGWGSQPCPCLTLICECGEDGSWRDHHYCLLARR
jgi:hypothetical protein